MEALTRSPPEATLNPVGGVGLLVFFRTFLNGSLVVEIEGRQRARRQKRPGGVHSKAKGSSITTQSEHRPWKSF